MSWEATLRVRISEKDVHYAGGLVAGAKVMELFGDVATELLIRFDGDEGLLAAYEKVEFKQPVHAGDYLEVRGKITSVGNTSRRMELEAWKVIKCLDPEASGSAAEVLDPPVLVARAEAVCVVPKEKQRYKH
ncbi:MAG: hotdog fold domain-containing protein [Bacillota bacterium]